MKFSFMLNLIMVLYYAGSISAIRRNYAGLVTDPDLSTMMLLLGQGRFGAEHRWVLSCYGIPQRGHIGACEGTQGPAEGHRFPDIR